MAVLFAYLRRQYKLLLLMSGFFLIFAAVFCLYRLPLEALFYGGILCVALGAVLFAVGYGHFHRRHQELSVMLRQVEAMALPTMPPPQGLLEEDYQALVQALCTQRAALLRENAGRLQDMTDYYTLWAHQIKTPIAAMHLLLQEEPVAVQAMGVELLRVEQYVDMVLSYLRLGSDVTDYVLRPCELDGILRGAVRKLAKMFILKHISLDFQETRRTVVTDEKWLLFVIEQLLSNALKYTREGGEIRIFGDGATLVIADNGIGIREEDLPRVFEKGFTGCNGRTERKSTGIGLYLCRQVMDRLNHGIALTSRPGQGTLVRLDLSQGMSVME